MSKPEDTPQDVWDGAVRLYSYLVSPLHDEQIVIHDTTLIARAIMAAKAEEREACAKIADDDDQELTVWGQDGNSRAAQQTARAIAAAIRKRGGE